MGIYHLHLFNDAVISYLVNQYVAAILAVLGAKGPYTRARKNASKTSSGKKPKPAATRVRKIKI